MTGAYTGEHAKKWYSSYQCRSVECNNSAAHKKRDGTFLCRKHYLQDKKYRADKSVNRTPVTLQDKCSVDDCPQPRIAYDLCNLHRQRKKKYGCAVPDRECRGCGIVYPWALGSDKYYCEGCILEERSVRKNCKKHGISVKTYRSLEKIGCGICGGRQFDRRGVGLVIDHDHSCCPGAYGCGKCFRGLLCVGCNLYLGTIEKIGLDKIPNVEKYLKGSER